MALRYPGQIASSKDYIKFSFGEYKTPFKNAKGGSAGQNLSYQLNLDSFTPSGESVYLPMPNDIQSSFGGNWGGKEITGLAQAAIGSLGVGIGNLTTGDFKNKVTGLGTLMTGAGIKNAGGGLVADIMNTISTQFANFPGLGANLQANDVLQLTTESIVNPNTELLYSGTGLRTHGYSFKMIPQSKDEANAVIDIIERFKLACVPKENAAIFGGTFKNFIGLPDLCQVSFISESGENPYLPKYKVSGITSVNVNYVTDGQFVAYKEGHPLGVVLTVALTETKLVFDTDLKNGRAR